MDRTASPWCTTWTHTKRLLFATEGRDHQTVLEFAEDLKSHGGNPAQVRHVCMDISAACAKGAAHAPRNAHISDDRFHVLSMTIEAMNEVLRPEMARDPKTVRSALGAGDHRTLKQLLWGMRRNPAGWSVRQTMPCTGCNARR